MKLIYLKHEIESHDTIFVVLRCRGGMPPSSANHQIVGETDRLNELAHQTYHKYLFDDIPTADGMVRLEEAKTHLNNINRGNATLWANVTHCVQRKIYRVSLPGLHRGSNGRPDVGRRVSSHRPIDPSSPSLFTRAITRGDLAASASLLSPGQPTSARV